MQFDPAAIEFYAFIGLAVWLFVSGRKPSKSKLPGPAPAADSSLEAPQGEASKSDRTGP